MHISTNVQRAIGKCYQLVDNSTNTSTCICVCSCVKLYMNVNYNHTNIKTMQGIIKSSTRAPIFRTTVNSNYQDSGVTFYVSNHEGTIHKIHGTTAELHTVYLYYELTI